jgi:K+-sensing histidine kinase KdpD
MKRVDEIQVWIVTGVIGSMALGIALIPLRALTSASNLAFVFLAFTIIVAELGGRAAALVTAVVSAMSLNFFLTEPYLRLTIDKTDDIVAFFALAACGFIAAAFGKRRERWSEVAGRGAKELDVLKRLAGQLRDGAPLDGILGDLKRSFGLSAVVLRDAGDRILAAAPAGAAPASIPETQLNSETLLPSDEARVRFGARGVRLPEGGGRLKLRTDRGVVWLDLWEGDPQGFGLDESRTLAIAAALLEPELDRRHAG